MLKPNLVSVGCANEQISGSLKKEAKRLELKANSFSIHISKKAWKILVVPRIFL